MAEPPLTDAELVLLRSDLSARAAAAAKKQRVDAARAALDARQQKLRADAAALFAPVDASRAKLEADVAKLGKPIVDEMALATYQDDVKALQATHDAEAEKIYQSQAYIDLVAQGDAEVAQLLADLEAEERS